MSRRFKVVITDNDYGDNAIECGILEQIDAEVINVQAKKEGDLYEIAPEADALIVQYAKVSEETLSRARNCKVVARYGIGVDTVDVGAASARGIRVTNVQDYCTDEVADHATGLWLSLVKKFLQYNRSTHEGKWAWRAERPVYRIRGRTMGIVSFGRIGRAIAERAKPHGVELIVFDPYVDADTIRAAGATKVSKEELVATADYICMQAPMSPETRHFLSDAEFSQMKKGIVIVNTGRGPTIDNKALYKAVCDGTVAGAGLDDPEEEPAKRASWSPDGNPIFTLENVIVTPHTAYYSEESIQQCRTVAASEVARILTGKDPHYCINGDALAGRAEARN